MAKILVVDDRTEDRELLVTLLSYARYSVLEATNGAEALNLVRTERPDLVVADVLLPSVDGYEFVRRLRDDPSIAQTKVVFYTALFSEKEAKDLAQSIGVCRIFTKPTEPRQILEIVSEELGSCELPVIPLQREQFQDEHRQLFVNKLLEEVDALSATEERFRLMAENASDLIFRYVLRPIPRFEYINPSVTEMLGFEPERFYSDPEFPLKIVHPDHREEIMEFFTGRSSAALQCRLMHKNGDVVWIEIRCTHVRDDAGSPIAIEGIARNITQRMLVIEEIRSSRDELEERVAEKTAELQKANEQLLATLAELTRSNEDLKQFAYVASHDLQEPLRNVASCLQMLENKYKGNLDADADKLIHYAVESSVRMRSLILDLLTYSRVATKGKPPQRMDCEQILDQTVKNLRSAVAEAKAVITHDPLPTVHADSSQLVQVFQNLIHNAMKFRREEPPRVHVSAAKNKNEWVFSVQDNGIGIEPEHVDRIFVIFQRLNKRTQYDGTGMGLAIVKKVVESHGGRVWVESEPGAGSTFYFAIPEKRTHR